MYESKRYTDLIAFLYGKRLHEQALELLQKLGKEDAEDVDEALRGPQRTIGYLQQLPPEQIDIILQYAKWPLEVEKLRALEIFTADSVNAESLPRAAVLEFLEGFTRELPFEYLQHVIHEWDDDTPAFHDRLIDFYLDEFKSRKDSQPLPGVEDLQAKFEAFLSRSQRYDVRRVLRSLDEEDPTFFESRAILYGRLHLHLQALKIYVFSVQSPSKAEAYCNSIYASMSQPSSKDDATARIKDPETEKGIYTTLLSLYLSPPTPHKMNLDAALDLLSRHGSRLPALTTLDFLPPSLSVEKLEAYFRGRMRAANTLAREQSILKSLSAVSKSSADISLHLGEEGYDEKGRLIKGDDVRKGQSRYVKSSAVIEIFILRTDTSYHCSLTRLFTNEGF